MSAASDVSGKLLAWLMGGTGVVLLYSAYKNRSPLDVLLDVEGQPFTTTFALGSSGYTPTTPSGNTSSFGGTGSARLRQIANREIPPDLVAIRPNGKLDREAAASLERINAKVGYVVPNVGSIRSFAEQAAAYARDPFRYGRPEKSLHVVGLAIDVHEDYAYRPEVIAAFTAEGWHRAREDEPWHWSFGVRG